MSWITGRLTMIRSMLPTRAGAPARAEVISLQEQLAECQGALSAAEERAAAFLGIASHELKTPVTSIKLAVQMGHVKAQRVVSAEEMADETCRRLALDLATLLTVALRNADRLALLVEMLLDYTRISTGRLVLRCAAVPVSTITSVTVEHMRLLYPDRSFIVHLHSAARLRAWADEVRAQQVLTNYLTNAVKYSGGAVTVRARLLARSKRVYISVSDRGHGIPQADLERVWGLYQRGGEERTHHSGVSPGANLGLGLTIARQIVELHDGTVGARSREGYGSTFYLTLPLAPEQETAR